MQKCCRCNKWFYSRSAFYSAIYHECRRPVQNLNELEPTHVNLIQPLDLMPSAELQVNDTNTNTLELQSDNPGTSTSTSHLDITHELNNNLTSFFLSLKHSFDLTESAIQFTSEFLSVFSKAIMKLGRESTQSQLVVLDAIFRNQTSTYLRKQLTDSICPVSPYTVGKFEYLPVIPQLQWMLTESDDILNALKRENILESLQWLSSPLDGATVRYTIYIIPITIILFLLTRKYLEDIKTDLIIPISFFYDDTTEVDSLGVFACQNKLSICEWRLFTRKYLPTKCFLLAAALASALSENNKLVALNDVIYELDREVAEPFIVRDNKSATVVLIFGQADNLAAHTLGGLFESFVATMPCLKCLTPKKLMGRVFSETEVQKRNALGVEKILLKVAEAASAQERDAL